MRRSFFVIAVNNLLYKRALFRYEDFVEVDNLNLERRCREKSGKS